MSPKVLPHRSSGPTARQLLAFGGIWLLFGWLFYGIEAAAVRQGGTVPATFLPMTLSLAAITSVWSFGVGVTVGWIELRYVRRYFSRFPLPRRILGKLLLYLFLLEIVVCIFYPLAVSYHLGASIGSSAVWLQSLDYLKSTAHLSTLAQLGVLLLLSLFYIEVRDFVGPTVWKNLLVGKYNHPVVEDRIFLFLDMRDSTAIAEQLGHQRYFAFLKAYYRTFMPVVSRYGAEVYQYVGDEVILSWIAADLAYGRCLDCYFAMEAALLQQRGHFIRAFGTAPVFKAAAHCGRVTAGEIGRVKKTIMFTGDVLNVTARIQGRCNALGVSLLVSEAFRDKAVADFTFQLLGNFSLRGRSRPLNIYGVDTALQKADDPDRQQLLLYGSSKNDRHREHR